MTIAAGTAADPGRAALMLGTVATITVRNLRRLVRVPTLLVFATVQPVLFVLLFTYAFGGAILVHGVAHYIDYMLPGIFVPAIGFGASQTGVAIAEDLSTGMIDRFRFLPISSGAVLTGRVAADALRNLFVIALMIGVGAAIGFRFHAGPAAALALSPRRWRQAWRFPGSTCCSAWPSATPNQPAWPACSPSSSCSSPAPPWSRWPPCPAGVALL